MFTKILLRVYPDLNIQEYDENALFIMLNDLLQDLVFYCLKCRKFNFSFSIKLLIVTQFVHIRAYTSGTLCIWLIKLRLLNMWLLSWKWCIKMCIVRNKIACNYTSHFNRSSCTFFLQTSINVYNFPNYNL